MNQKPMEANAYSESMRHRMSEDNSVNSSKPNSLMESDLSSNAQDLEQPIAQAQIDQAFDNVSNSVALKKQSNLSDAADKWLTINEAEIKADSPAIEEEKQP